MNQEKQLMVPPRNMPIFICSCGKEILIVPDIKQMNRAIEAHLSEHRRLTGDPITEDEVADQILTALSQHFF